MVARTSLNILNYWLLGIFKWILELLQVDDFHSRVGVTKTFKWWQLLNDVYASGHELLIYAKYYLVRLLFDSVCFSPLSLSASMHTSGVQSQSQQFPKHPKHMSLLTSFCSLHFIITVIVAQFDT